MTKRRIIHPHALDREEKPRQPVLKRCVHCDELIREGEGGMQHIPTIVSNRPPEEVALHSKCLRPYLAALERSRPKLPVAFPEKLSRR